MLETFLHNNMEQKQKVNKHVLRKYENTENGCDLWFASKCRWPLQELVYNAVVATPKQLCCLEKILLYIYQLIPDSPPDSKTMTTKLCLGETSFIDKIISDLVNLGALEVNSTGRLVVTPLGHQCCSRGQLPSQGRKQKLPLCFDPVAHKFPQNSFLPDETGNGDEGNTCQPIVPVSKLRPAEPYGVNIDRIRLVAALQGLLPGGDAVVFDAEPIEAEQQPALLWREVYVFVFLNEHETISLRVYDPKSKPATEWFQSILDKHLEAGYFTLSYFLGSLILPADMVTNDDGDLSGFSRIPAHEVQDKILSAINNASKSLFMQTRCLGDNGSGHAGSFIEAIKNAAARGVTCRLLWTDTKIKDNIPTHQRIEHRLAPKQTREFLMVDDDNNSLVLVASASQVTLTDNKPAGHILTVGESKRSLVCEKWKEKSIEAWQNGSSPFSTETIAGLQKNNNQITNVVTADTVQKER